MRELIGQFEKVKGKIDCTGKKKLNKSLVVFVEASKMMLLFSSRKLQKIIKRKSFLSCIFDSGI